MLTTLILVFVLAYAAIAVLIGALTILTVGRAEERRRALNGCPA